MSEPTNSKQADSDVLAAAAHPSGKMRILGRTGRDYGVLRPGDLAWVSVDDLDGAWTVVQGTPDAAPAEARKKAKD